ncbi:hypothetical protein MRX96_003379 [Rhipicephalus microplus]
MPVADDAPQMDDFPDVEGESNKDIKNEEEKQKKFLNLFSGLKVFLGREVPRESLTFVLRSFGAEVSWDESLFVGSTFPENDPTVTHQIVDRPEIKKRLHEQDYFMGEVLPPHLSPFVEEKEGDYVPPERLAMLRVQRGEEPVRRAKNSDDIPESEDEQDNETTVVREDPEKVAQRIKSEEKRLAVLMIPKKHKRLYDKIVFGQKRRAREAAALKQKREEIKKSSKKAKKK